MKTSKKIIKWAKDKDLLNPENIEKQHSKLVEECGELGHEIRLLANLREIKENLIDDIDFFDNVTLNIIEDILIDRISLEIGDNAVVLEILSNQVGLTLKECKKRAYQKIKNRTGETVNGEFIRD